MAYKATELKSFLNVKSVIMIHYFEYPADFVFAGEAHDFWEMVYVDKGEIEAGADEAVYILKEGDLIFHKPMEFHTIRSVSNKAPNLFVISFEAEGEGIKYYEGFRGKADEVERQCISGIISESRRAFVTPLNIPQIEHMVRLNEDTSEAEQMIRLYLERMLLHIKRRCEAESKAKERALQYMPFISLPNDTEGDPRLRKVMEFMLQNLDRSFTVEELASVVHISRSRLQALFREHVNCGAVHFFHRLKIEKAKELIRESDADFTEIAFMLGYRSLSAFSKKFKNFNGMSPKQYKESVRHYTPSGTQGRTSKLNYGE